MPRKVIIPKLRRHATGQAFVRTRGKNIYFGRHGTPDSEAAYKRFLTDFLADRPAPGVAPEQILVKHVVLAYLKHADAYYRKGGRPTAQVARVRAALRHVRDGYGPRLIAEFGAAQLVAVRKEMVARGLYRRTVNGMVNCVRLAWRWAAEEGMIPASLWHALACVRNLQLGRSVAPESADVRPVPLRDVARTLPCLPPEVADMVRVQYRSGMRPCEVCHLRVGDVNRDGLTPAGKRLAGVWVYAVRDEGNKLAHKGIVRLVLLGPHEQATLAPHLDGRDPEEYVFSPARTNGALLERRRAGRQNPLWPSHAARRRAAPRLASRPHYSTAAYNQCLRRAARRAGVPRWTANQLRHARATAVRQKHGLAVASSLLGHKSLETTLIYADADLDAVADAVRRGAAS